MCILPQIKIKFKNLNNSRKCHNHACFIMWFFCSSVVSAGSPSASFLTRSVIFHHVLIIVPEELLRQVFKDQHKDVSLQRGCELVSPKHLETVPVQGLLCFLFCFWLHWVTVGVNGLSLVVARGAFPLQWLLVAEHGLQDTQASVLVLHRALAQDVWCRAELPCHMWDLTRPGIETVCPALAGKFLTTGPPVKSQDYFKLDLLLKHFYLNTSWNLGYKSVISQLQ